MLKPSLSRWYQGTVDLHRADYAFCEQKARDIHAFRNGQPRSCFKFSPEHIILHHVLTGDSLIWLPQPQALERPRSVFIFDLKAWALHTLGGEAREEIRAVFASDQLIAMTTFHNICYVSTLNGQGQKKFRVPSHFFFDTVTCRGRTVACAAVSTDNIAVYIWDYDTQRGKSFQINPSPSHLFLRSDTG